jgi:hypothetical protein
MRLTRLLLGIGKALDIMRILYLRLLLEVGHSEMGRWWGQACSGPAVHARGVERGVGCHRHFWGGVVNRRGRGRRFFLDGGFGGLVGAGVLLGLHFGYDELLHIITSVNST